MKKTALVTGGAGGIGEAVVRRLCADGFAVAINYHSSEERANALSSELVLSGFDCFTVKADVSDSGQVADMIKSVVDKTGSIDVLVNNSGVALQKLFDTVTDSEWQKIMGINLTGTFNCSRSVLPFMLSKKYGRIINISSMWGQIGASCEVVYSASKAGVIGMTKALAKEVAPSGITVNCVSPGAVDTEMMKCYSKDDIEALCEEIPVGRLATPKEIASAVSFFADENSGYITGQVLGVNGGMVV